MNEGQSGQIRELRTNIHFVELADDQIATLMLYLQLRLISPIVGLIVSFDGPKFTDLTTHPFGNLIVRTAEELILMRKQQKDTVLVGFTGDELELLKRDAENQEDLGDPRIMQRVMPVINIIEQKWQGAAG